VYCALYRIAQYHFVQNITLLYCTKSDCGVLYYSFALYCSFCSSFSPLPLSPLILIHPPLLPPLTPLLDWFKAGKGPDPVAASLDRDMDAYFNSKAAAAAAGGDVVADATITVDVVAVAAN
jgi:hypothetical protein